MRPTILTLVLALLVMPAAASPSRTVPAGTKIPAVYDNCTKFNKKYPHGVGKVGARDMTKSKTADPVTNFKRSNTLYKQAMRFNADLDRDKDGIACEKA
jgi:hypothetical protein